MRPCLWITISMLGLAGCDAGGAEPISGYDDPAVAICEMVTKSNQPPGAEYSRTGAKIDGLRVTIAFTTSILNTRPKDHEEVCQFEVDGDGEFRLEQHKADAKCSEFVDYFVALSKGGSADLAKAQQMRGEAIKCQEQIDRDLVIMKRQLVDRDAPLIMTGIYPIAPGDTALTAE